MGPADGQSTVKTAPEGAFAEGAIVPPWLNTMSRQSDSPMPVPAAPALVVKKGSKMRSAMASGTPGPLSATVRRPGPAPCRRGSRS